ncbi:hypothetical protein LCGC14_1941740 [marine sediment metagenome]|uniref:Uncharacterized protein n=1 Tax=marine sediment metagenome TaxID=412755 RepID=A0A0F9G8L0_9ZZZZ|nr:hypothetical protein [Nitrospirota bacterium]
MDNPVIIYLLVGFGFFILVSAIAEFLVRRKKEHELETLSIEARRREVSEYDLFKEAASTWNIKKEQADRDFKEYLRDGALPYYIRQMLRTLKP